MGLVVLRGAVQGELAGNVAKEAIVALLVFACVGAVAGWICDYLVRQTLEDLFRRRVDWYRQGLIDAGYIKAETSRDD